MSRKHVLAVLAAAVLTLTMVVFHRSDPIDDTGSAPAPAATTRSADSVNESPLEGVTENPIHAGSPAAVSSPSELLEHTFRALPALAANEREALLKRTIESLRNAGATGLRAVAAFLRSGRDVSFADAYGMRGNQVTAPSTLRVALLGALENWEGSASVMLEFLRSPSASIWELVLAIRTLELEFPSTYRAEATAALKAALSRPVESGLGEGGEVHLFATVARLHAAELLPSTEALAVTTSNVPRYLELLNSFPIETRASATASVFRRGEVADEIEAAPQTINYWPFRDAQAREFIASVFRARLSPEKRVAFIDSLDGGVSALPSEHSVFSTKQNAREADRAASAEAIREAQARKTFLAELAKDAAQPAEVKAALQDAQQRVTADLAARATADRAEATPLVEIGFAQGSGKAQIKGRRIEQIDLQPAPVALPASTDSTDLPER